MPLWNFCHFGLPDLISGSCTHRPPFRWVFPMSPHDGPSIFKAHSISIVSRNLILADFSARGSPTSADPGARQESPAHLGSRWRRLAGVGGSTPSGPAF